MITRTIISDKDDKDIGKNPKIHNSPISEMFGFHQTLQMPVFQGCPHTIATRKCWLYFYFFENWKALNNQNRETNYATLMKMSPNMVGTIIVQQTSH